MDEVTISILNYNGQHIIEKCLDACFDQTYPAINIQVIDNASTDKSVDIIKQYPSVKLIQNKENSGFVSGVNQCIKSSPTDKVLFLCNDVILSAQCLSYLYMGLRLYDIVQPLIIAETGAIDNYGMSYKFPGYGTAILKPPWRYVGFHQVPFTTMTTFLTRKSVIEDCNYFDTKFSPAYYEDVDFYMRNRYRVNYGVCDFVSAVHIGNYSFSMAFSKRSIKGLCREHRKKFIKRHYKGICREFRLACVNLAEKILT